MSNLFWANGDTRAEKEMQAVEVTLQESDSIHGRAAYPGHSIQPLIHKTDVFCQIK